jgi:HSP20 family protein
VLNVPVDVEKAEATFENGVLTLTLPKAEEIKPKTIKVKTK